MSLYERDDQQWTTAPAAPRHTQSLDLLFHLHNARPHIMPPRFGCEAVVVQFCRGLSLRADDPTEWDLVSRVGGEAARLLRRWRYEQHGQGGGAA